MSAVAVTETETGQRRETENEHRGKHACRCADCLLGTPEASRRHHAPAAPGLHQETR